MEETKKSKKLVWVILLVIFLLLLCCIIPTSLFFVEEGRGLYRNVLEFMNIPLERDSESDSEEIAIEEKDDFIVDEIEEEGKFEIYTSEFFPELSLEYPKSWSLSKETTESRMTGAKDVSLNFTKKDYTLQIDITPVGPIGLYADCYTEEDLDYVRIQEEYVRNYDGENYSYGYLYDSALREADFEEARAFEGYGEEYIACGDLHILGVLKTSFFDEDFFSNDYLYAIVGARLLEKGSQDQGILLEADVIVKNFLE